MVVDRAVIRGFVPSWCPLSQMLMEKVWGWGGDAEGSGGTGQGGVGCECLLSVAPISGDFDCLVGAVTLF